MKGDLRRRVLAKPGLQKNGQQVSLADLKQAVDNFNPDAPPPVTPGHPKSGAAPALGRVISLELADGALIGHVRRTPELISLEEAGRYAGWSVGLHKKPADGTFYLHHLAALGQHPPASDIADLGLVELDAAAEADLVILDVQPSYDAFGQAKETNMDPKIQEQIDKAVKEAVAKARQDDAAKIADLEAKLAEAEKKAAGGGKTDGDGKDSNGADKDGDRGDEAGTQAKELSVALETIATERRERLTDLARKKGLTDDQMKPLMAMLAGRSALELADSGQGNVFEQAKAFIAGLPDPAQDLTTRVELGDGGEPIDTAALCAKV